MAVRRGFRHVGLTMALLCAALVSTFVSPSVASRFSFTISSRLEECFLEDVDARTSENRLLFRFGIVDPEPYDFLDVTVRAPSQKVVEDWNKTQTSHTSLPVRETGLYQVCFKKRAGSSKQLNVYYAVEFISTGSVSLVLYPTIAATIDKAQPDQTLYTMLSLETKQGGATKMGVIDFALSGVSSSILHPNTRVQLMLSVDYLPNPHVELTVAHIKKKPSYPISWTSMSEHATGGYKDAIFDSAIAELGGHISYDVTEMLSDALNSGAESIAFSVHSYEDAEAILSGMSYVTPDYYPQLVVEDMGLDLMREVGYFRETVFQLRGNLAYIRQKELRSREVADSTNSRVMWLSIFTNILLVGMALSQVLYVRKMLEGSY